jgi:type VI secretion system protein ImpJ
LADEIPQAIQWHEGMLLAPQHFQQSSWRQEMLAQYNALLVAPYCWGVRRLALDLKLLPSGTVRVLDLEAVLPDGTLASHKPSEKHELMIAIGSDESVPKQGDVAIHLALPARNSGGIKGGLLRYEATDGSPVVDENTGEGEVRMPVLRPRLTLIAGQTPPPKYVSMPIAAIRFEDEAWVQTEYVAPAVAVPARSPLGELCSGLARTVREKAMYVSEQVRAPSAVLNAPLTMENRSHLQSLVAGLPQLEALLSTDNAHPLALYVAVCSLAGHLASLGVSLLPPVFPPYDHNDLRASFEAVIEFAIRMTNEGIPETYTAYPFKLKDRLFSLMFEEQWIARRIVMGLRAPTGISERELISWGEECLIGSESVIASLRHKRIRGAQRQFLPSDPELMPVRGVVLFAIRPDAEFVKPGETLQVFNFGERGRTFSPVEIVLYVKRGNGMDG